MEKAELISRHPSGTKCVPGFKAIWPRRLLQAPRSLSRRSLLDRRTGQPDTQNRWPHTAMIRLKHAKGYKWTLEIITCKIILPPSFCTVPPSPSCRRRTKRRTARERRRWTWSSRTHPRQTTPTCQLMETTPSSVWRWIRQCQAPSVRWGHSVQDFLFFSRN